MSGTKERGTCSCGWSGPWRTPSVVNPVTAARADAERHLRETHGVLPTISTETKATPEQDEAVKS